MAETPESRLHSRARLIRALAHPTRLLVVETLAAGDCTVSELTELAPVDISTVSRHLSVLRNAGIVSSKVEGNRRRYSLRTPCVLDFLSCFEDLENDGSSVSAAECRAGRR